ncbi:hypothetical protein MU582_03375 [Nocardioidaceae bacterium SCSIO 66511]|nr:hypothetical protein MU582_03375 [Nocardioidaceae bacterium SCSIO 66511]
MSEPDEPHRTPNACWWCGDPETTGEHKFKHSDLKRLARENGQVDPTSVYKGGEGYSGTLRSLKKGAGLRWEQSLCGACNNHRSQPFDIAYTRFSEYVWERQDHFEHCNTLDFNDVFGMSWSAQATNLARYLGKQLGCVLAEKGLPIAPSIIRFLNGDSGCSDVTFVLWRDRARRELHRMGQLDELDVRGYWLPPMPRYTDEVGAFVGTDYAYIIGFFGLCARYRTNVEASASFFESATVPVPLDDQPFSLPD